MYKRRTRIFIGIVLCILLLLNGCGYFDIEQPKPPDNEPEISSEVEKGENIDLNSNKESGSEVEPEENDLLEIESPRGKTEITISAVGDIMTHGPQIQAALMNDGTYDFKDVFSEIKPYLESSDITIGNLETTISTNEKGYMGYPTFKAPEAIIQALVYAGFDVLTTANNHSFDGREFGVQHTIEKLDEYGLAHTGTAISPEMRDQVLLIEKNEIKVAILAYTYGTNGMEITIPKEKLDYMVNYDNDMERIKADIDRARDAGAEIVIACMHWGWEYWREPNDNQIKMADSLFNAGVDIILGSHPHVLQPMERKNFIMPDGSERDVFVIYSLGNFISNQRDQYRDSGIIINIKIIKDHDKGTVSIDQISYVPTWVYKSTKNGKLSYKILPAGKFKDEGLEGAAAQRVREVWQETTTHMGSESFTVIE